MLQDKNVENLNKSELINTLEWADFYWLSISSLIALQATTLFIIGQPIMSQTTGIRLWCDGEDCEESQHLIDRNTVVNVIHGVVYNWIIDIILPNASASLRFFLAIILEIFREIIDNALVAIDRYRRHDAYGYSGDSIVNSVSDTIAMAVGFCLSNSFFVWIHPLMNASRQVISVFLIMLALNILNLKHFIYREYPNAYEQW